MTPGLASVASAVLDHNGHPVAGLAVTYPVDSDLVLAEAVTAVRRTADQVSRRIGGPGPH